MLLLSACATLPTRPLQPLKVAPLDLHLAGGGLLAQRVHLTLSLQNPNPFPVTVEGIATDLLIGDQKLASGVSQSRIELPEFGQKEVALDATVATLALLRQIALLGTQKPLTYRLSGKLRVKRSLLPAVEIPFEWEDRLDFWNFFNRQAVPLPLSP